MEKLLELDRIGKVFGTTRVLEEVSFDLHAGEIHLLAGENGAGKSTLIKIIGGIYQDFEGTMRLRGRPVRLTGPQDASQRGISVIHQELSLVESMNVIDNIRLGREATKWRGLRLDRAAALDQAEDLCRKLHLELERSDLLRPVEQFSMSIKTRIEIAKALAFEAQVLVMDEPTSALSQVEAEALFEVIRALKNGGCGIVYISHKMEEIYRLADRITVLRDGHWIATSAATQCPEPVLIEQMVGRPLSAQLPPRLPPGSGREEKRTRLEISGWSVRSELQGRPDSVRNFSLALQAGEIVGLAGLQGSGSTELLRSLFGAIPAGCSGSVQVDQRPYFPRSPSEAIRRGLGYLTADRKTDGLVMDFSVTANVTLASLPQFSAGGFLRRPWEERRSRHHIEQLRIRATPGQPVGTLSGGNQQKTVLAKWLEISPAVLLLDEPTRGVDVGAKREIYHLLREFAAAGVAILLVSTELPELIGLSDRIMVLHRGHITAELQGTAMTPERILAAAMADHDETGPIRPPAQSRAKPNG